LQKFFISTGFSEKRCRSQLVTSLIEIAKQLSWRYPRTVLPKPHHATPGGNFCAVIRQISGCWIPITPTLWGHLLSGHAGDSPRRGRAGVSLGKMTGTGLGKLCPWTGLIYGH